MIDSLAPFLPEVILSGTALLITVVFSYLKVQSDIKRHKLVAPTAMLGLLLAFIAIASQLASLDQLQPSHSTALFLTTSFGQVSKLVVILGVAAVVLASRDEKTSFEFYILLLIATVGAFLMLSSHDLMGLFLALELMALPSYILAAFFSGSRNSTEAGVKYFILGAVASAVFLYGTSLLYGMTGSTSYNVIRESLMNDSFQGQASWGYLLGIAFIVTGLGFKCSAAPFHMWAPDVYEGAPTVSVTFFAGAAKFAAVITLALVVYKVFAPVLEGNNRIIIQIFAAISMLVGAFGALPQTNIKRLLAYSSIGHVGYALMAVTVINYPALASVLLYMIIYTASSIGAFAVAIALVHEKAQLTRISSLKGLAINHKFLAFVVLLLMFSLAGIPPFAGFFAKYYVFTAVIKEGDYWLALVGGFSSVVAAFYYLRIVKIIWFDANEDDVTFTVSNSPAFVAAVCALLVTAYGLFGGHLWRIVYNISSDFWLYG